MSFWTPVEDPRTRPLRSWAFDIALAVLASVASFGSSSFAQGPHPEPELKVSLIVAILTVLALSLRRVWPGPVFGVVAVMAAVLTQWPVRGELFPVALGIGLYTVAVTLSRTTALVAAALAVAAEIPAAGQGGASCEVYVEAPPKEAFQHFEVGAGKFSQRSRRQHNAQMRRPIPRISLRTTARIAVRPRRSGQSDGRRRDQHWRSKGARCTLAPVR